MSALATVLVLGIIAIAQAQRGVKDPPSMDATEAAPESAPSVADAGVGVNRTEEPRLLPQGAYLNPLRTPKRTFGAQGVRTTAVSGEESPLRPIASSAGRETPEPPTEGLKTKDGGTSPSVASRDPFGLRTRAEPRPLSSSPSIASAAGSNLALKKEDNPPASLRPSASRSQEGPALGSGSKPLKLPAAGPPTGGGNAAVPSPVTSSQVPALLNPMASSSISRVPRSASPGGVNPAMPGPEAGQAESGRSESSRAGEGTGKAAGKQFDGPQAPQVTIQKVAPPEAQVGKPATFQIKLKNTGPVAAFNVEIRDVIPKGARLITTSPKATPGVRGELVWQLGTVKPGDEVAVEVQLLPIDEGEISSVASVSFSADASARTVCTKPQLLLKASAPATVLIGEDLVVSIVVSNPGSGIAHNVVLEERIPAGLQHASGPELINEIGDLKPNESRQLDLKLTAVQPGVVNNVVTARGDANLKTDDRLSIEVLAPQLQLGVEGPKRRFLEREATYAVSVSNPGTAPAKQVELIAQLPTGLKFVRANNSGHYEEATRSVRWRLEELPIKETGTVELVTLPVEIGEQMVRLRGTAEKGLAAEKEHPVVIEGISAVMFEVAGKPNPIEVNGETTYEIHVVNQGSKAATNIQVSAVLPAEMRPVAAEGPTHQTTTGNQITFEPLPRLAAKADTTYRVRVQGLKPGDQRVRVQLVTDEIRVPITKEESTQVYSDQ
jgi:uncharacterized repeat protein (TIGR01451 family)